MLSQRAALAVVLLVFAAAVVAGIVQRWPYIGTLTEGHHQWLMAEETKFVEYWEKDGIWADRMLTLESPKSIEAQTLHDRIIYTSFLPGCTLQIYLVHQLFRDVELPTLISFYGIALQALMALVMGLLVYRMIEPKDRGGLALFFVCSAMLTYLFHPAPYYFHSMIHMGFLSVLFPYTVALYLEYALRAGGDRRLLWWQGLVTGWMAAHHWLFIPFCLSLSLFRVISPLPGQYDRGVPMGLLRTGLLIWTMPALIILAYVVNLHFVGMLEELISRAMIRMGQSNGTPATPEIVYRQFFVATLGNTCGWLLLGGIASVAFLVRDRKDPVAVVCCTSFLTACLYVTFLPNDVVAHDFTQLFFFVPLSLAAFGIMPYRVIWLLHGKPRLACFSLMAFLWAFYLIHFRTDWPDWYQDRPPATQKLAEWLRANATFNDVFLSDSLEIADNPPVPVAISRKRVWMFATPAALDDFRRGLPAAAQTRFVSKHDFGACFDAAASSTLPDGSRLYVVTDWSQERLRCLAERWQGKS